MLNISLRMYQYIDLTTSIILYEFIYQIYTLYKTFFKEINIFCRNIVILKLIIIFATPVI